MVDFSKALQNPKQMITSLILLVVGLQILVQLLPDIITAIINFSTLGPNISGTVVNLSFSGFFAANGVVLLALSAGIILAVIGIFGLGGKSR